VRDVLTPAYKKGFRIIFIIGASLAALAFFLSAWLIPQLGLKRADDEKLKEEGKKRIEGTLDEEKR
jgi:lipopolysaccharide export LptBFGC system permease protein LptF